MENKIYTVIISEGESDLIEQLQYETHVQLSILHYLLRQGDISDDIIEKYNQRVVSTSMEYEVARSELVNKYIPDKTHVFNYNINFREKTITYTMKDGNHDN